MPLRLAAVDSGHSPENQVVLDRIREQRGTEPSGVLKTLYYRPEIFGRPFSDALELAMRGESDWTPGGPLPSTRSSAPHSASSSS